jgi:hypothetical protein
LVGESLPKLHNLYILMDFHLVLTREFVQGPLDQSAIV